MCRIQTHYLRKTDSRPNNHDDGDDARCADVDGDASVDDGEERMKQSRHLRLRLREQRSSYELPPVRSFVHGRGDPKG